MRNESNVSYTNHVFHILIVSQKRTDCQEKNKKV